jgi:hypothetical protein
MEQGIGIFISSPLIEDARGTGPEPYAYLIYDMVSPVLHDRLRKIQMALRQNLGLPEVSETFEREVVDAFQWTVKAQLRIARRATA